MNFLLAGLTTGLLGSLHCLGMCGPLMLALPATGRNRLHFLAGRIACQGGRVLTYMVLGALFGVFGKTLVFAGWQRGLSIVVGLLILVSLLARGRSWSARATGWIAQAVAALRRSFGPLLKRRSVSALFGVGMLNGLLPCGLVYVALAMAAATGTARGGAEFMAAFGLGTVPALLGVSLAGRLVTAAWRLRLQRLVPGALVVLAALFILRGLSLGIPYVSPDLSPASEQAGHGCCSHH